MKNITKKSTYLQSNITERCYALIENDDIQVWLVEEKSQADNQQ